MKLGAYFLLCILMILSVGGCGSKGSGNGEVSAPPPLHLEEKLVEVVEVIPKSMAYTISAVGSLKTPENVIISTKKGGFIKKILVREGDRVKRGQILIQLEDVDARLYVEKAEAGMKEVGASLENSRTTLSRYQKLLESKVIPQQTYDDLIMKVKLNEAKLILARAELNLAKQNLLDHIIVSPIEGMINIKIASLGEYVNVAPKDEILTIVQMDPLDMEFFVPEIWAGKTRLGNKVQFTVKAFPDEKFSATLNSISPTADASTRNVKMKAEVPNPGYRLKPGFFVEVSLQTGSNPNTLVIPESALFSQEGLFFTYAIEEGMARRKEVETGQRFEGQVEILKGIKKGQRVVTVGHEQLTEGTKVQITKK